MASLLERLFPKINKGLVSGRKPASAMQESKPNTSKAINTVAGIGQTAGKLATSVPLGILGKLDPKTKPAAQKVQEFLRPKNEAQEIGQGVGTALTYALTAGPLNAVRGAAAGAKSLGVLGKFANTGRLVGGSVAEGVGTELVGRSLDDPNAHNTGLLTAGLGFGLGSLSAGAKNFIAPAVGKMVTNTPVGVNREFMTAPGSLTRPKALGDAIDFVRANPDEPFLGTVKGIEQTAKNIKAQAQKSFDLAADDFIKAGGKFNLSQNVPQIAKRLGESFKTIGLKQVTDKTGKLTGKYIVTGLANKTETRVVNEALDLVRNAKNISPEGVLRLRDSFSELYDKLPLGSKAGKKALTVIREATEEAAQNAMPPALKEAFGQYRELHNFLGSEIGKKLFTSRGTSFKLKTGAEGVLKNLVNENKGLLRESAGEFSDVVGDDLLDTIQTTRNAQTITREPDGFNLLRPLDSLKSLVPAEAQLGGLRAGANLLPSRVPGAALGALSGLGDTPRVTPDQAPPPQDQVMVQSEMTESPERGTPERRRQVIQQVSQDFQGGKPAEQILSEIIEGNPNHPIAQVIQEDLTSGRSAEEVLQEIILANQ